MSNGQWDLPEYGYTECLRQQEYSSRTAWVTFGIILAVLVPIVVLGAVVFACYQSGRVTGDGSTSWEYNQQGVARSAPLSSQPFLPDEDRSSSGGSLLGGKPRRMYDKVYRTHEPLPGRPLTDFEDKVWDLQEEDSSPSPVNSDDTSTSPNSTVTKRSRQTDMSRPTATHGQTGLTPDMVYSDDTSTSPNSSITKHSRQTAI